MPAGAWPTNHQPVTRRERVSAEDFGPPSCIHVMWSVVSVSEGG
jgi:hypothetical protein